MTEMTTTARPVPTRDGEEVWELTVPGRVHVEVTNHLGRPADATAVGKGSRLRLSTLDRQLAEERVRDQALNPFRNGTLVQVVGAKDGDSANALSDADMLEIFALSPAEFESVIADLTELNIRRLKAMTILADATASQIAAIDDLLQERYPIGGSMPTYDEMMADPTS